MSSKASIHFPTPSLGIGQATKFNGSNPWDIKVHNYPRMAAAFTRGSLGLGEAYMDGVWDCEEIDTLFSRLPNNLPNGFALATQLHNMLWVGRQKAAYEVGAQHYSIGNDLYEAMLDKRMVYTCAKWDGASNLEQAQENKLALSASKLELEEGMRVLDIGSGWGSMMTYLAEHNDVRCTGLTVSEEQARLANERNPRSCQTLVEDYREHKPGEPYDRIVSLGMFEHVGARAYRTFFECAHSLIKKDGVFLLHCITSIDKRTNPDPWLTTYIFPNSQIPAVHQAIEASEGFFRLEHAENLGGHNYDKTLMAWWHNFDNAFQSGTLDREKYGGRFYRMWELYLRGAAGNFRAEKMGIHQFKFRKL